MSAIKFLANFAHETLQTLGIGNHIFKSNCSTEVDEETKKYLEENHPGCFTFTEQRPVLLDGGENEDIVSSLKNEDGEDGEDGEDEEGEFEDFLVESEKEPEKKLTPAQKRKRTIARKKAKAKEKKVKV